MADPFAAGIGNFGFSTLPSRPPPQTATNHGPNGPPLPPGLAGKSVNAAPLSYLHEACNFGLRICTECELLPLVDPRKHPCDVCGVVLHGICGAAVEGGSNRCLCCCKTRGVPSDAGRFNLPLLVSLATPIHTPLKPPTTTATAAATAPVQRPVATPVQRPVVPTTTTTPSPTTTRPPLVTVRANRGPSRAGKDPGRKKTRKSSERPSNVGVIEEVQGLRLSSVPEEEAIPPRPQYHNYLVEFMEYHTGNECAADQMFTPAVLRQFKAHHVREFLCFKAFGKPNPDFKKLHDRPVQRWNSIAKVKTALSHYMPDKSKWSDVAQCGNPCTTPSVNEVMKRIRYFETKDMGAKPKSKRNLSGREFVLLVTQFFQSFGFFMAMTYRCYAVLAYNLIFRSDDVSHLKLSDLIPHSQFDFALELQVKWSKNVKDNRACPPQILLGCMDTTYCVLLNLALFLELCVQKGNTAAGYGKAYMFTRDQERDADGVPKGPKQANARFQASCSKIFTKSKAFVQEMKALGGSVGSHSIRKFASTFCKRCGCSAADVEFRGRWKGDESKHRVVNGSYISPDQPFIDAQVASVLCQNQPCSYRIHKEATGVTDEWVLTTVVPGLHQFCGGQPSGRNPALILGYALLWAAMSPEMDGMMCSAQREHIRAECGEIQTLPDGVNPVVRVHLFVRRCKDSLLIDEMKEASVASTTGGAKAPTGGVATSAEGHGINQATVDLMFSNHQQLIGMVANQGQSMQTMFGNVLQELKGQFEHLNRNLCKLYVQPPNAATVKQRREAQGRLGLAEEVNPGGRVRVFRFRDPDDPRPAKVAPQLRFLGQFYQEWEEGIGGNLPAKLWTEKHCRGNPDRSTYSRRRPIYLLIDRLVHGKKKLPLEAFSLIEKHFNGVSMGRLGKEIRRREENGTLHPDLADRYHPLQLHSSRNKRRRLDPDGI